MSKESNPTKHGKGGIIALVSGCIIVALIVVIVVMATQLSSKTSEQKAEENKAKRNVVVTAENVKEVVKEMKKEEFVAPGSYEVTMNTTWTFTSGDAVSSNAYVENAVSNTNDVYFDITLADTQENIYSSPVLPIGSHIKDIALDKVLDDGTYDCVCTYTLVDEEQNALSSVRVSLTIIVGK